MATKVAVVTGVAQGIGKAFAGVLLKEGYKVSIYFIQIILSFKTIEEDNFNYCCTFTEA